MAKEEFHGAKKPIKTWDTYVDNIVFSKSIKTKNNFKYFIIYLDNVIRPLVLMVPKTSGYAKTFKGKDRDKDKKNKNKLISLCVDDEKMLEKDQTIWYKIKDFQNIELNTLPVYGDMFIKTKIKKDSDNVYTNFRGSNMAEDGVECVSFTIISFNSWLVYENKCYLQVYLDGCTYKIVDKQMIDYFRYIRIKITTNLKLVKAFHNMHLQYYNDIWI